VASPAGLALAQPVFVDSYRNHRISCSFILIDDMTHQTPAAGMIE
jgi:sulfate adenylyltransferase subunit 1 (EFTu-like GTPase family)